MQTKKIIGNIVLAMFVFFYVCNSAFGRDVLSNEELLKQISKLRELVEKQGETIEGQSQRIKELEAKHGIVERKIEEHTRKISELAPLDKDISERLKGQLKRLETAGAIEVGAGITFVGQGTPNANAVGSNSNERIKDSRFGASYSADVEIAKAFGNYGFAFVHLETGDGETIEGDLSLYPRCSVNRDADRAGNVVSLTEAWYEQYLFNDQIIITGGKIDPTAYIDVNEFANDETTQFLGSMFRNSPAIEFSDNSIGGRVYMTSVFFPAIDLGAIYLEGGGNWDEVFSKPFLGVQLSFMPEKAFGLEKPMWRGKYRAYFWYNGTDHTSLKEALKTEEKNFGFGLSCDQNITDVFGIFERFGWQNPKVAVIEYHWSVGGQMTGKCWKREEDVVAIAVGQVIPGKDCRDTVSNYKNETHLEAYYAVKLNDHLTLTPDMQVIWEPDGGGTVSGKDSDTIFVYGVRGQVDF